MVNSSSIVGADSRQQHMMVRRAMSLDRVSLVREETPEVTGLIITDVLV